MLFQSDGDKNETDVKEVVSQANQSPLLPWAGTNGIDRSASPERMDSWLFLFIPWLGIDLRSGA